MIEILPDWLSSQIAASEIIERPESVVKELLENSLDAGAKNIKIKVEGGGLDLIFVEDNGVGIPADQVETALMRFATSKIKSLDDLSMLRTYGFRGEGLYAISQLSRLSICSRHLANDLGREIVYDFGKKVKDDIVSCSVGTSVLVKDLFENAPARKKFQAEANTENKRIKELVKPYLLANKDVQITLSIDGKVEIFQNSTNRVIEFFGDKLAYFSNDRGFIQIEGYIGLKSLGAKGNFYILVNRRPVQDSLVLKAVKESLTTLVKSDKDLCGYISLNIDPSLIDCNVHPRKLMVRFLSPSKIYQEIFSCVQKIRNTLLPRGFFLQAVSYSNKEPKGDVNFFNFENLSFSNNALQNGASNSVEISRNDKPLTSNHLFNDVSNLTKCKFLGMTNRGYLIFHTTIDKEKILIIDPHAAHERLLYEKILFSLKKDSTKQPLLMPVKINHPNDSSALALFKECGITLKEIDNELCILEINSGLLNLCKGDISLITSAVNESFDQGKFGLHDFISRLAAKLACKSSIQLGDHLAPVEAEALLLELSSLGVTYCPHGRPFVFEIDCSSLDDCFRR